MLGNNKRQAKERIRSLPCVGSLVLGKFGSKFTDLVLWDC